MTKHCSTIVPPTNFPSEFSTSGKRHNIGKSETLSEFPEFDKSNSPLPLIQSRKNKFEILPPSREKLK